MSESLEAFRQELALVACPLCGEFTLQLVEREGLLAKPLGSFSLAGMQPKISAHKVMWPWLVCSRPECEYEERGKY